MLLRGSGGKFFLPRRRRSIPRSGGWEMSIFFPRHAARGACVAPRTGKGAVSNSSTAPPEEHTSLRGSGGEYLNSEGLIRLGDEFSCSGLRRLEFIQVGV